MGHELRPCSVAIGLGSHDLGVADATVDLYHRGLMPLIVFTGATSRTTREAMPKGEAWHYRERALERGVPADAILVEPQARNTAENIALFPGLARGAWGARRVSPPGRQAVRRAPVLRHGVQDLAGCDLGQRVCAHDVRGVRRHDPGCATRHRHAGWGATATHGLSRAGVHDQPGDSAAGHRGVRAFAGGRVHQLADSWSRLMRAPPPDLAGHTSGSGVPDEGARGGVTLSVVHWPGTTSPTSSRRLAPLTAQARPPARPALRPSSCSSPAGARVEQDQGATRASYGQAQSLPECPSSVRPLDHARPQTGQATDQTRSTDLVVCAGLRNGTKWRGTTSGPPRFEDLHPF